MNFSANIQAPLMISLMVYSGSFAKVKPNISHYSHFLINVFLIEG